MSLTSVELNYLIWRYLQESGFELAAYAFEKNSKCLDYAHPKNAIVDILEPGCLPNLVQKGILYALLEDTANNKALLLTLVEALIKDQKALQEAESKTLSNEQTVMPQLNGTAEKIPEASPGKLQSNGAESSTDDMDIESHHDDISFTTEILLPSVNCSPSLAAAWHPSTSVIALGMNELTAVIHALNENGIAESVLLSHPPIVDGDSTIPNPISFVAWDPQGTMVVTSGANGEMRAWSPDGRLKNVVNSLTDLDRSAAALSALSWNHRGLLAFTIDLNNNFRLWDGTTLSLLQELRDLDPHSSDICACWLGDKKFAVSTGKNTIKIYSVTSTGIPDDVGVMCVGQLAGHAHQVTNMAFSPTSRLLASLSDVDYVIKVWNSQSSQDAIELNAAEEKLPHMHYHTTPIIGLHWLNRPSDVQGIELLSASMDGSVNIWDAFTGDALISANVFENADNYRFKDEQPELVTKNSLIFATAISPDGKYLAIGDDSGNVSIWDISVFKYNDEKDTLRCLGLFGPATESDAGVCELAWDHSGKYLSVCYQGIDSAVFEWLHT